MSNQHGTSETDPRLDWLHDNQTAAYQMLTQYTEGTTAHYYGFPGMVPLTEAQARQLRRAGVVGEFDATRPLSAAKGGE